MVRPFLTFFFNPDYTGMNSRIWCGKAVHTDTALVRISMVDDWLSCRQLLPRRLMDEDVERIITIAVSPVRLQKCSELFTADIQSHFTVHLMQILVQRR